MSKAIKIISLSVVGLLLVGGGLVGWQVLKAKRLASEYAALALSSAQDTHSQGKGGDNISASSGQTAAPVGSEPSSTSGSGIGPSQSTASGNTSPSAPASSDGTPSATIPYKQLMADTYTQSLNAMETVKANTLALQNMKISLSAYKASILKSKETFSSAQAYVQANPPSDDKLAEPYQEFLTGITLANQSMDVVLHGISSLDPASFFAAKEMGSQAKDQVNRGYSNF
ncbi:MAG: hypothetical protein ACYCV0_19275 [Desulfitobacteriaceae bacterium]